MSISRLYARASKRFSTTKPLRSQRVMTQNCFRVVIFWSSLQSFQTRQQFSVFWTDTEQAKCETVFVSVAQIQLCPHKTVSEGHIDSAVEFDNACQALLTVSIHEFLSYGTFHLVFIAGFKVGVCVQWCRVCNHWSVCTGSWWRHRRTAGPERRRQCRYCVQKTKGLWETDTTGSRVLQVLYRKMCFLYDLCWMKQCSNTHRRKYLGNI